MITPEIREELRRIQTELKKPLPAKLHEVRELPGGAKKWVFLPWQVIRNRLDEVCPEWMPDYSEIQYMGNDAICRCAITILGVRKEAIASVPISVLSSNGKEMTRGSAADRLAAEALKNASETWGLGAYLDNQEFTIRYLWDNRIHLSEEMNQELQRLIKQYKISIGAIKPVTKHEKPGSILHDIAGVTLDRNLLNAEIESIMKRKNISLAQAKSALNELFEVKSRQQLSDKQLADFLDYLKSSNSHDDPRDPEKLAHMGVIK